MFLNNKTFNPRLIKNRINLAASYLRSKTACEGFPLELALEITNRCNADCIMCSRRHMQRPIGDMDLGLFKKIIDKAKSYTELIWLHLAGEPLLHPKLFEMITYAKSCGIKLGMSTNAISLDEGKATKIIASGLDLLIISFDGATKETYEKIRQLSNYEKTLGNIMCYLRQKSHNKKGPYTQMQLVYMEENKKEAMDFMRMWKGTSAEDVRLKPYFQFPDSAIGEGSPLSGKVKPCFLLWRQCSIYWDGTVVSCCWDFLGSTPLGNIKDAPLAKIWNGAPMQAMRKKHLEGRYREIELCRNCKVPQIGAPYLLGSILIDDLSIKKLLPVFDNLHILNKIKLTRYYR